MWFEKYLERILRTSYSWRKTRSKRHNSSIHFHRIIIYIACYHNEISARVTSNEATEENTAKVTPTGNRKAGRIIHKERKGGVPIYP